MRKKLIEMKTKVVGLLTDNQYMTTRDIAAKTHLSIGSVRTIIKQLRSELGIISTRKGHVLAEYATVNDDVEFLRRLNGRRASDVMAISGVRKHIEKRWKAAGYTKQLNISFKAIDGDMEILHSNVKLLTSLKF